MAPLAEGETMLMSQGPIGLWSKEVHFVGNTVPFGMQSICRVSRDDVTFHRRTCLPPITRFTSASFSHHHLQNVSLCITVCMWAK